MDGFSSIPIQNTGSAPSPSTTPSSTQYSSAPYKDNAIGVNDGIEIVETGQTKKEKTSFGFLFPLSVLSLVLVFVYFGYLYFIRVLAIEEIAILTENFQVLSQSIDKSEIDGFVGMDNSLKAINQKLGIHTQLSNIFSFVNKNIRTNIQINDYRVESREKEVVVFLSSVAPTFRELAEQTEKMTELKNTGALKDFTVSGLALESDGRRLRYSLSLVFDKSKISVAALARQNSVLNSNNLEN